MSICLRCDATNPDGNNFCARCGNSLVSQHPGSGTAPLSPTGRASFAPQNPQQQVWVAPPLTQGTAQHYPPAQAQPPYPPYTSPPTQVNVVMQQTPAPRTYQPLPATGNHKSLFLAFILTFFLGPFGLFYSTVGGAILMIVISIGAAVATAGVGLIVTQIMCIVWGVMAADSYNKRN